MNNFIINAEKKLAKQFERLDSVAYFNQEKVLNAFKKNKIALRHFTPTTGYGYGDDGRDTLKKLVSDVFGCENAVVSPNIVSGTHALCLGLFSILMPGDKAVSISGTPYDTLLDSIYGEGNGSLKDYNIGFDVLPLKDGEFDKDGILNYLKKNKPKMVFMQRSRGYEWRNAISMKKTEEICTFLRENGFDGCIFMDNCYGEFVEEKEPTEIGVDVVAGSLIKNLGGGLAPTGGYLAGKNKYIQMIENRLTSPSIGGEVSSYAFTYQYFYQGLFVAPHTVKEALKGSLLLGQALEDIGYETSPCLLDAPADLIRAVNFNTKEELIEFIRCIQGQSPIDSYVTLEPWDMPGYEHQVIMAAGCFVQGSSIELSADAPIKEPYIAYVQGGLTYEHVKIAVRKILEKLKPSI